MARSEFKLTNMANFQRFDPAGAYDLAAYLGRMCGEMGDQTAADAWFAVASANAAGIHPPGAAYCGRVAGALKATAAAMQGEAERIDKEIERHALEVRNKLEAANRKKLTADGQKSLPKDGGAGAGIN